MSSVYLAPGDYAHFGAPGATADAVLQASALIDTHIQRPEGLVWAPGADGAPAYMAATAPQITIALAAAISPGSNVAATLTGQAGMIEVGDVLLADAAASNKIEALTVTSMAWPLVTFRRVGYAHDAGATLDLGRVITEKRFMPKGRPVTQVSRSPIRLLSLAGRYTFGRRGDHAMAGDDYNLLASLQQFGGVPVWEAIDPLAANFQTDTREVWVPAGIMSANYSEVRVHYLAGFSAAALPAGVKRACAMLVNALASVPDLGGVKSYKAGNTAITRFANTMIDSDLKDLLKPHVAAAFA